MNSIREFETDPKRDATPSIRGYVHQAYQTILAWMNLNENEILVLEGAEDFDIHCGTSVEAVQVKAGSGNVTLRSQSVIDSINNYWEHCLKNPDFNISLRFLATSEAGQEQGFPFGPNQKGLEFWEKAKSAEADLELLRAFLLQLSPSKHLKSFLETATAEELQSKLIQGIVWDLGSEPIEGLQYLIEDRLKRHGLKLGISSQDSCLTLAHLLKIIADLLSTEGPKELRFGDFLTHFDEVTRVSIPRSQLESPGGFGSLQSLLNSTDQAMLSRLVNRPAVIGHSIPLVDGGVSRIPLVSSIVDVLQGQHVVFLYGSSGMGKTNLASLVSCQVGERWGWANFRGKNSDQIRELLSSVALEITNLNLPHFIVLDDLDLSLASQFERELIVLVFSIISSKGMLVVTGPLGPPISMLPKIWLNDSCQVSVPALSQEDIEEMVRLHGLNDEELVQSWVRTIWLTTSGHPQLVHARVRSLSINGWPSIQASDLIKPEDIERVRSEARNRLVSEFPAENVRVLAYRLSLINGSFSRKTAIAVAQTSPQISLPGEAFDALVGPWVERETEIVFRISPLLKGAANNVLSDVGVQAVHTAIATTIVNVGTIDQFEAGTAFFHALMAKNKKILVTLSLKITTTAQDSVYLLYEAMSWFTVLALDVGQKIFPSDGYTEFMLRLAQYRLISASGDSSKVLSVIERIEDALSEIQHAEIKPSAEGLAYGMILNTIDVHIPSSIVVRMLSRMIDLIENTLELNEITNSFHEATADLICLGGQ